MYNRASYEVLDIMCENLYKKIKDVECESNLYISNNKVLFETIYNLVKDGVPIPSAYYISDKLVDRETDRYILTKYIYDADNIIYKVEAHTKIRFEKNLNLIEQLIEKEYLKDGEVENLYVEDKYNELDSLQIYVSHPNFEDIWNDSTMSYFINCYHDEHNYKILTHVLEKEEFGYDLQIELFEIPKNPIQIFLVANHLSKIREALQCGPLMHFFFTKTSIPENVFEKIKIRKNEIIFMLKKSDYLLVVISIHYHDISDKYIALGLCKNIHFTTKTMDLSGNLDCSFYADFPSHLITSEYIVYNKEIDKDNYSSERKYSLKNNKFRRSVNRNKRDGHQANSIKGSLHQKYESDMSCHSNNSSSSSNTSSSDSVDERSVTNEGEENLKRRKKKKSEVLIGEEHESKEETKKEVQEKEEEEKAEEEKIPNVGFMALKMDIKLFNSCKDFSELIQISSRISHIIVSFRDFINNALVLYRIKQRRTF